MALPVTLAELRTAVREGADCDSATGFLTDAVLDAFINRAVRKFYDEVVGHGWGGGWYETEANVAITAGTSLYSLPADLLTLRAVEWMVSTTERRRLKPWQLPEGELVREVGDSNYPHYRIRSGSLDLQPAPGSSGTVIITYVPTPSKLTDPAHTVDDVCGWSEAVVQYVVVLVKQKESDPGLAEAVALYDRTIAQIRERAPVRDSGGTAHVVDVGW